MDEIIIWYCAELVTPVVSGITFSEAEQFRVDT